MRINWSKLIDAMWIILCIVSGICFDYIVLNMHIIIVPCEDIRGFTLNLITIIVTLVSIVFSIIAIISGSIDKKYLGVNIVDFYLNKQSSCLTYKELVCFSFVCILFSIWCYSIECYNVVFGFLYASILIVIKAVSKIFDFYIYSPYREEKIESYVNDYIEKVHLYENLDKFLEGYIKDWTERLISQSEQEFNLYKKIYELINKKMLDLYFEKSFKDIETKGYSLINSVLSCKKMSIRNRGLELAESVYDTILIKIKNSDEIERLRVRGINCNFDLLYDINYGIWDIDVHDPIKFLIRSNIDSLIFKVLEVEIAIDNNYNYKFDFWDRVFEYTGSIRDLAQFITSSIINCTDESNKSFLLSTLLNSEVLTYTMYSKQDSFVVAGIMNFYLDICIKLLCKGKNRELKKYFYLDYVGSKSEWIDDVYTLLFILSVHGYLYYLAEKEVTLYIDKNLRESALELWDDKEIQEKFHMTLFNSRDMFYLFMEEDKKEINKFSSLLSRYVLKGKTEQMHNYMAEFYLFTIILIHIENGELQNEWELCVDVDSAYDCLVAKSNKKEDFVKYCSHVYQLKDAQDNIGFFENIYDEVKSKLIKLRTDRLLKQAKINHQQYKDNAKNIDNHVKSIFNNYKDKLANLFSPLYSEDINKINLKLTLNRKVATSGLIEIDNRLLSLVEITSKIFEEIVAQLRIRTKLEEKQLVDINKIQDIDSFDYIIGNENKLKKIRLLNELFNTHLKIENYINIAGTSKVLFFNKDEIAIKINSVTVGVKDPELINDEKDDYFLDNSNILRVDKEEYIDYKNYVEKIVEIEISYSLEIKNNCKCMLVK